MSEDSKNEEVIVDDNYDEFDAAFEENANKHDDSGVEEIPGEVGEEEPEVEEKAADDTDAQEASGSEEAAEEDDELKKAQQEIERLKHKDSSQRGRLSALTKQLNELRAAQQQPPEEEASVNADEDSDWEEFQQDFPEIAEVVNKRLSKFDEKINHVKEGVKKVTDTQSTMVEGEITEYRETQMERVRDAHPDIDLVTVDPAFIVWRNNAPADIQEKRNSLHAEDAIAIIDAFKESQQLAPQKAEPEKSEIEKLKEKRRKNLEQSAGIGSKKIGKAVVENDDFDSAFAATAKQKEKQKLRRY